MGQIDKNSKMVDVKQPFDKCLFIIKTLTKLKIEVIVLNLIETSIQTLMLSGERPFLNTENKIRRADLTTPIQHHTRGSQCRKEVHRQERKK